jgi:hypothetical protein
MSEPTAPIMCTLSADERPGRLRAFEELFADHRVGFEREPRRLRLIFDGDRAIDAGAPDLFAREQRCCAFITLAYTRRGADLLLDVGVPDGADPLLDWLEALAERSGPAAERHAANE